MRKGLFSITKSDFQTTKDLFNILKVPYFDAPLEAETTCADLCLQGKVDAVLTEDTDVLAYEAPVFLTKLNTSDGTCVRIKYSDVLQKTNFSGNQFLDFCIMCGTDYNKNIFKVGPSKALKLIEKYETIEKVGENAKLDITILNHKRTRQLFREYKKFDGKVPYCGEPDFLTLQKFLFQKNLRINVDSLRKSFVHNNIIILEDEKENLEK
jgi:5'-3' exonuclease